MELETKQNTIEVLNNALAGIREAYIARYVEIETAGLVAMREELAAAGMDADKVAPYPSGMQSRANYRRMKNKRAKLNMWFASVAGSYSYGAPNIVAERPEAEARLVASAKISANAVVDSYIHKLAKKIGKEISAASANGRIWDGATLAVECVDGERQTWDTKCILNRSCLGTIFNQWPTRRRKVAA